MIPSIHESIQRFPEVFVEPYRGEEFRHSRISLASYTSIYNGEEFVTTDSPVQAEVMPQLKLFLKSSAGRATWARP